MAEIDLNALVVFGKVAALKSFSAAAHALDIPKSNVSRAIARLEEQIGVRLLQRTTRSVELTEAGHALKTRCAPIIEQVGDTVRYIGSLREAPRGKLKVSSGVGFGINILAEQLPEFLKRYPSIEVTLSLGTQLADLVTDGVDVAIRLGPMPDSTLVSTRLGLIPRSLCAAPDFLARHGSPGSVEEIARFDAVEMPGVNGRGRSWHFERAGETFRVQPAVRVCVDEMTTLHRLVMNGAGLGVLSGYVCAPAIAAGRLIHLLSDWRLPPVDVSIVFPSRRELAPTVRAFAEYMKEVNGPGVFWQEDVLL